TKIRTTCWTHPLTKKSTVQRSGRSSSNQRPVSFTRFSPFTKSTLREHSAETPRYKPSLRHRPTPQGLSCNGRNRRRAHRRNCSDEVNHHPTNGYFYYVRGSHFF